MSNRVAHVFKTHPKVKELFETSDEMLFFKEHDANAHSQDLKDKHIRKHTRPIDLEEEEFKGNVYVDDEFLEKTQNPEDLAGTITEEEDTAVEVPEASVGQETPAKPRKSNKK